MEQYWIWLSGVEGIGVKRFYRLLSEYGDARNVWDSVGDPGMAFLGGRALENLRAARNEAHFFRVFSEFERLHIRAVPRISEEYPASLHEIFDPPATLYVRGDANLSAERMFAIVGTRRATRDGKRAAREFARTLAGEGVSVVSGLARGVDTAAHEGALEGGAPTIAVLGSGADVIYPPENELLAERILDAGGAVVSEYVPGAEPSKGNFPQRNRIISGLCAGVLLVEGAENSGAMITVNLATEQGRDVFAVPGSIYSPLSAAPNRLIQLGAPPALSGWDILEHYRWASRPAKPAPGAPLPELDEEESTLVTALREQELSFDELCSLGKFPAAKLNSLLTMLVLRGIIVKAPGGLYRAYQ